MQCNAEINSRKNDDCAVKIPGHTVHSAHGRAFRSFLHRIREFKDALVFGLVRGRRLEALRRRAS